MNKAVLFGAAALAALLPAVVGLTANPSLSARVPLAPTQLQVATAAPASPAPTTVPAVTTVPVPAGSSRASATHRPSRSAPSTGTDDHGGDRPAGSSDDTAADDHGGGSGKSRSGKHGSDD